MASWPLDNYVNRTGFALQERDNTIRSQMGYGPDKLRRRTTVSIWNCSFTKWLTTAEYDTIVDFYKDNQALAWDWVDPVNGDSAVFRFLAPPSFTYLGPGYWVGTFVVEYELA